MPSSEKPLRPTNQLSASIQLTDDVSLGAYYQFEWAKLRVAGVGSYFSTTDTGFGGGAERLYIGPFGQYQVHGDDLEAKDSGQGGAQLRMISGDWEFGLYTTRFHAKTPTLYQLSTGGVMPPTAPPFQANIGEFYWRCGIVLSGGRGLAIGIVATAGFYARSLFGFSPVPDFHHWHESRFANHEWGYVGGGDWQRLLCCGAHGFPPLVSYGYGCIDYRCGRFCRVAGD
jgi:hypothetical protein